VGKPSTKRCLELAIEGETYEFTEMYPKFELQARMEGHQQWLKEIKDNIDESKVHAEQFQELLVKAEKRFCALKKVEEKHANAYKTKLEAL
jgi:rubrerythrin